MMVLTSEKTQWITVDPMNGTAGSAAPLINLNETGGIDGPYIDVIHPFNSVALLLTTFSGHVDHPKSLRRSYRPRPVLASRAEQPRL